MTTAIAVAAAGHAVIAADSRTHVNDRQNDTARKLWQSTTADGEPVALAWAGDGAVIHVYQRAVESRAAGWLPAIDDPDRWADILASNLTSAALEHSLVEGGRMDGTGLLIARGRIWTLHHHQAIAHVPGPGDISEDGTAYAVSAIGSGQDLAIGAAHVSLMMLEDATPDALMAAATTGMHVALRYDGRNSGGPVWTATA